MPLSLFLRGRIWHYEGRVAGRRVRGSTRTAIREVAERLVLEKEQRIWKNHFDPQAVVTFADAAMLYRDLDKPERFLRKVEDYWKDTPIKSLTSGLIRAAAISVYPDAKPQTRNRQFIVPTQAIVNNAAEHGVCQHIRVKRFEIKRQKVKKPANWQWVQSFIQACNDAGKPRLGAIACLMYLTGARISQAIAIDWDDVDFQHHQVLIRATQKGDDDRMAHMPDSLIVAMANIPGEREGPVFGFYSRQNCEAQWDQIVKQAKLKRLTPHSCRHGFATDMLDKGISPKTVAARGGWKNVQHVLQTYAHDIARPNITDILTETPTPHPQEARKINENK